MAVSHVFSNPVADATGTMTIWAGATTQTVAVSDIVKPSDWNSAHLQVVTLAGNTAGVATLSGTNIVFDGGANATLSGIQGANAATLRFSGGAGGAGNTGYISVGANTASLGTVVLSDANGVSFGLDGQTVTASHNGLTSQSNQAFSAQGGSSAFQTLSFNNANGISFSNNAGAVEASYTRPVVSNAIQAVGSATGSGTNTSRFAADDHVHEGIYSVGVSNDAGNTAGDTRVGPGRYVFRGGPNITLSQITAANGLNTIVLSGGAGAAGNTGYLSAGTTNASLGTVSFADSNGVSFGIDGQTITATVKTDYLTTAMASNRGSDFVQAAAAFNGTNASGTIASNAISVSVAAQSVQPVAASAGNGSVAFATLSFSNANGISFSTAAGPAIVASHNGLTSQSSQSAIKGLGVSNTGQTAGNTGLSTGIDWVLAGSQSLTLSQSTAAGGPNTIWFQHPAWITTQSGQAFSADASSTFQTLTFQDSNGISFSNNAGALRITHGLQFTSNTSAITSNALHTSVSRVINIIAATNNTGGGTASLSSNVSFSNANGLTFYTSAGNAVVGSYTVPTQSNQTGGIYALGNTTGQSSSSTYDLRTLSIEGAGFISVGWSNGSLRISGTQTNPVVSNAIQAVGSASNSGTNTSRFAADDHVHPGVFSLGVSNVGNSAGDTRVDVGRFVLAGGANITLSQATAANALNTISIVAAAGGGETRLTAYAVSNTTQSSSGTIPLSALSFHGAGIASVGVSNGSVIVSVPAGGGAGDGGVFAGVSNLGNTAGSTGTVSTGNFVLVGSGPISLSQSTGAAGSAATITISAPATSNIVGTLGIQLSTAGSTISIRPAAGSYVALPPYMFNSATQTVAESTSVAWPIELRHLEEVAFLRMARSVSVSSMASIATAANNTKTYNQQGTFNFVMYSRGVGASSQSLQSVDSTSHSSRMSIAVGQNANGSQWTVTHAFTFPASNGTTSLSTSYATTLSNVNVSTTHLTALSGMKLAAFPWSMTREPSQYWLVYGFSTAHTTNGNASLSNMRVTFSHWGMSQPNNTWGELGSANNASIQAQYGVGSFSTAGGGTTASLNFSNISSSSSHVVPYITLAGIA